MLSKIQYYIGYAQTIINYAQKVIAIVNTAVGSWPKWSGPAQEPEEIAQSDNETI